MLMTIRIGAGLLLIVVLVNVVYFSRNSARNGATPSSVSRTNTVDAQRSSTDARTSTHSSSARSAGTWKEGSNGSQTEISIELQESQEGRRIVAEDGKPSRHDSLTAETAGRSASRLAHPKARRWARGRTKRGHTKLVEDEGDEDGDDDDTLVVSQHTGRERYEKEAENL